MQISSINWDGGCRFELLSSLTSAGSEASSSPQKQAGNVQRVQTLRCRKVIKQLQLISNLKLKWKKASWDILEYCEGHGTCHCYSFLLASSRCDDGKTFSLQTVVQPTPICSHLLLCSVPCPLHICLFSSSPSVLVLNDSFICSTN